MDKVFDLIAREQQRQDENVELIASENFVSERVLRAVGSCLTNKYAEGYPAVRDTGSRGRYYGGCRWVDQIEQYCCDKWREAFATDYHVNVQPHCGSNANLAAFMSVLKPGDTILSMSLSNGGHLTHGSPVNFSGKLFRIVSYDVTAEGFIDYDDLARKAAAERPALILAGASAYSRIIDFERIAAVAKECGAYFMVDMAHIAGLVLAGDHPSPFGLADIITTTTHKTLRGPRGGMIFCRPELARKVDSAVPGHAGRSAGACDRGQGRRRGGGVHAGIPRVYPPARAQLQGDVRRVHPPRLRRCDRRNGQPSVPARSDENGTDGPRGAGPAGGVQYHIE